MADQKISQLTLGIPADTDVIPYVDLADGITKKATISSLRGLQQVNLISGDVDGSNQDFVFDVAPNFINTDGTIVPPEGNNGTLIWTPSGLSVHMENPPTYILIGLI